MKHTFRPFAFFAFGLLPCVILRAQEPIQYKVELPGTAPSGPTRPDTLFRAAEARLARDAFDPAAESLLQGIEGYTKSVFNVPSLHLQKAGTERVLSDPQRGDVLIAEWDIQESFGSGLIVLTDTPYYSNYELRLSGSRIESQSDLTAFLHALLAWRGASSPSKKPSIIAPPTTVSVGAPPITFFEGHRFGASPFNFIADFQFSGMIQAAEWFIGFRLGKSGTQQYFGVPPWIPERFPPLSDLVKSWGSAKIRSEVGRPVKPFGGVPAFTQNRDRILIAELARQGLSADQAMDLLTDVQPTPDAYNERLGAVIIGFQESAKGQFVTLFFQPALATYQRIGVAAVKSVTTLFSEAALRGCTAGSDAQAMDVLKESVFVEGPLRYLGRCSTSRQTIAALETMTMPTESLEKSKNTVIGQIRRNIQYPRLQGPPRSVNNPNSK